jgi:hypothetical protein
MSSKEINLVIVKPEIKEKPVQEFWKVWNSKKCKKSCCFEGLGSLF